MNSLNAFQAAMDLNAPPGVIHPILEEKYAWVDERLREMYYGYALTSLNCDEFEAGGLLNEHSAWVDRELELMFNPCEENLRPLALTPIAWVDYRSNIHTECIEDNPKCEITRERSESSISYYEEEIAHAILRAKCYSPSPSGKTVITPTYDDEFELSSEISSVGDDMLNVSEEEDEEEIKPSIWSDNVSIFIEIPDVPFDDSDVESYYSYDSY